MFNLSATLIGAAGSAFLAVSFVPGALNDPASARSSHAARAALTENVAFIAKGDRIAPPRPAMDQAAVSTMERLDGSRTTFMLKDHDGEILFRPEPLANMAYSFKRNQPAETPKGQPQNPASNPPASLQQTKDEPQKKRRTHPFGCMASVSPLAQASADQNPSLCLAYLKPSSFRG
ncbi:hypothetical protein [Microvirga sp. 2TAF3]|uniref:hypothetical protein n=1 Tax=Microvirga sp. 2TAF3 TaxID=3233014 RepID=UPI003F94A34F